MIASLQLCDEPAYQPPEQWAWEAGEERQLPGEGDFLLSELMRALPCDILVSIEAPSRQRGLRGISPETYARLSRQALQRLLFGLEKNNQGKNIRKHCHAISDQVFRKFCARFAAPFSKYPFCT
ncbi:MAG: hypothetical protein ABW049_04500 [Spongiibacteraceae bacterium]